MVVYTSAYPHTGEIPEVSLHQYCFEQISTLGIGDKPAFIDGPTGRTLTYDQVVKGSYAAAANLNSKYNISKGSCFGVFLPNVPEYSILFLAASRLGAICTTINPLYTAEELNKQLVDSGAELVVTIPLFVDKVLEGCANTKVTNILVLSPEAYESNTKGDVTLTDVRVLLSPPTAPLPEVTIDPKEDLIALPYSSGTTGVAKGVMLTHYNLVANIWQTAFAESVTTDDVLVGVLPFFHIYGLTVIMLSGIRFGASVVTYPRFDLEMFLEGTQKYKITRLYIVPPICLALAKHPIVAKYDLSSVKYILSGAAPLSAALANLVIQRLNIAVKQGYGMTELSPVVSAQTNDLEKNVHGSCGPCLPLTEMKFIDSEGRELENTDSQTTGELLVKGPQVMKGYLGRPEETAATIDSEGWLHTGDIGYVDAAGSLYIVDRVKELIKFKGFQVPPAELEGLIFSNPKVADAAVVPAPDVEAGEIPVAYIVKKPDEESQKLTEEEIKEFVNKHVASYKHLKVVRFTDQIPKSASGKILRRILRDKERALYDENGAN